MKRNLLLHAELSQLVASLGHGDMLVLGDAGLPIPVGPGAPLRIDLAVSRGTPQLQDVLKAVLSELQVESTLIAQEAMDSNGRQLPSWYHSQLSIAPRIVTHEEFKKICGQARAMVRTGECTPYANVILVAGVTF